SALSTPAPAGAVDVTPARTDPGAAAPRAGAGVTCGAWAEAATSPPLAFRAAPLDLAEAVFRRSVFDEPAVSAEGRSSDDFRIQPSRETFAHPAGALPDATATVVPASSEATLFAVVAPRARTTADRFPTRGAALPRCADRRARSTKPSMVTFA